MPRNQVLVWFLSLWCLFVLQVTLMDKGRVVSGKEQSWVSGHEVLPGGARAPLALPWVALAGILQWRKRRDFWSHTDTRERIWIAVFDARKTLEKFSKSGQSYYLYVAMGKENADFSVRVFSVFSSVCSIFASSKKKKLQAVKVSFWSIWFFEFWQTRAVA